MGIHGMLIDVIEKIICCQLSGAFFLESSGVHLFFVRATWSAKFIWLLCARCKSWTTCTQCICIFCLQNLCVIWQSPLITLRVSKSHVSWHDSYSASNVKVLLSAKQHHHRSTIDPPRRQPFQIRPVAWRAQWANQHLQGPVGGIYDTNHQIYIQSMSILWICWHLSSY